METENRTQQNHPAPLERIALKIELTGTTFSLSGSIMWGELLSKLLTRALSDAGILCDLSGVHRAEIHKKFPGGHFAAVGNQAIGIFGVANWRHGVQTVQAELASVQLLSFSQIARFDASEQVWRLIYPAGTPDAFADNFQLLDLWLKATKERLQQ